MAPVAVSLLNRSHCAAVDFAVVVGFWMPHAVRVVADWLHLSSAVLLVRPLL